MKEKEGKTLTLNDKGILLTAIIIVCLAFALGFVYSEKMKGNDVTIFTREDLEKIEKLQSIEDQNSGGNIRAYKDKDGNLMIGWDYEDSKKDNL